MKTRKSHFFILVRFLAEFTSRVSSLITFPLLAKYLGAEGYGVNAQTNSLIAFIVPIATLGLGYGVVRLIAGTQDIRNITSRFYSTIVVVSLFSAILGGIMFAFAPFINNYFIKVNWATEIIQWSSPLILLSAIELTIKDYYRARLRIISYSFFQIAQTVSYVGGVALVLINHGGLLQVVWLWLIIKVVFNLLTYFYFLLIHEINLIPLFVHRSEMISLLKFGLPIVIAGIGAWVTNVGDRWVIGYFMTIKDVAIYNAAYTLAGIIIAIASPFWNPLYPLMSAYYNDNNTSGLFQATKKYMNGFSLISFPSVFGLIILANPLLIQIGSAEFSVDIMTFGLIIFGIFIDQLSTGFHYQIYLHNDTVFIRNAVIISGSFNIILNLILVPLMGIRGASLATFVSFLILDIILYVKVMSYKINIGDMYDFQTMGKYCISAIIMSIMVFFISQNLELNLLMLVIMTITGAIIYMITLLSLYKFNISKLFGSI